MRASQPEPLPSLGMRVLELWRYPIKSIGGERLDVAEVAEFGIVGDYDNVRLADSFNTSVLIPPLTADQEFDAGLETNTPPSPPNYPVPDAGGLPTTSDSRRKGNGTNDRDRGPMASQAD